MPHLGMGVSKMLIFGMWGPESSLLVLVCVKNAIFVWRVKCSFEGVKFW